MNINEAKHLLNAADMANDTVLFEGVHGIGKSDVVKQYARENNYFCKEVFLSMMDTGDLIGIPRTKQVGTSTITAWAEPDWFQQITDNAFPQLNRVSDLQFTDSAFEKHFKSTHDNLEVTRTSLNESYAHYYNLPTDTLHLISKDSTVSSSIARRSVLFLDELNRSNLDVRQAALQLILNKEIHSHKLPYIRGNSTIIVAAINPSDAYQVDELDPALLDRFMFAELKADTTEWLSWARSNKINQVVQDFIAEKPTSLHWTPKDGGIGATPRSWAKLAAFMDNIDKSPKEIHFSIMKGKIGSELAGQFLSFYNNYSKVVKVEDIETAVIKAMKRSSNPEDIAKPIMKLIANQESIQKNQLAEVLYDKYVVNNTDTDPLSSMACIAFLYAIEIENLASFLKARKEADHTNYMKLANFDKDLNNKGLFTRITSKIQK